MNEATVLRKIIENRKSVFPKDYTGEAIEEEVLEEILNSAKFAPNHKKTKPWRLRVFRSEEKHS